MSQNAINASVVHHDQDRQVHPLIIVGGGLVGGLCALLFAKAGIQPLVLDAAPELDAAILKQRDPRVLALSPATISLLEHAGVWRHIQRKADYVGMQVWARDGYGQLDFGSTSLNDLFNNKILNHSESMGSMVEPSVLGLAIQAQLQQLGGYQTDVRVKRIEQLSDSWQLTLQDGRQLTTTLLVGADGGHSFVRQCAGIAVDELDYQQVAVSCAIRTEKPHQHIARQVFLPTGPLAFLPMVDLAEQSAGHWQSVVWTLPEQDALALSALTDEAFLVEINQASGAMLGTVQQVVSRAKFPLKAKQAQRYVLPHLALIGDAAHVVHPMAGQGVNLGCLDAALLVDSIMNDASRGLWASWQSLNRYEVARRSDNSAMMHALSMLGWIQGSRLKPVQWLKSEGMHRISRMPTLLQLFTEHASGRNSLKKTRYAHT